MATVEEKRLAREWALREITGLISIAQNGTFITFGHRGNRFCEPQHSKLVDIEIERIKWQLDKRHSKLSKQLGM